MKNLLKKRKTEQLRIDPRWRYRRILLSSIYASPVFVGCLVLLILAGTGGITTTLLGLYIVPDAILLAIGSLIALCMWLFAYAALYIPSKPSPVTVPDVLDPNSVDHNLADAAGYPLLVLLGKSFHTGSPTEVGGFVHRLVRTTSVREILARLEIPEEAFMQVFEEMVVPEISWEALAHLIGKHMAQAGRMHIEVIDVATALLLHPNLRVWLRQRGLQESDIMFMGWWQHQEMDSRRQRSRWWAAENILDFTGVGLSWAAGYTTFVDRFARIPSGSAWDVGATHKESLDSLMGTLARTSQSNVLLVGQPGVGRIGVVKDLMRHVGANTAHPALRNQRVLYMHVSQLASLGSTPQEQTAIVSRALAEMERAGNIIAVLDGLGSILGGKSSHVDATDLLVPFFSSNRVRVVVVLSTEDYQELVTGSQELERVFEVVEVPPLSEGETLQLLALSAKSYESQTGVFLTYAALKEVIDSTSSILPHIPFPEKAFDVVEELVTEAQGEDKQVIRAVDVEDLITQKVGINIGRMKAEEGAKLSSLADFIHRRVVNQEEGVQAVSRAMVRARAGVRSRKRPVGSFLFLGPTGVGKTETAKALAETYFGSPSYLQRLDMSEFQNEDAIGKLVGTSDQPIGRLLNTVSSHPFCVLLLDEFEKASPSVQQLFLPLLDEGYLTDFHGRTYSFVHTIIIATSNAGSEFIRTSVSEEGSLPEGFSDQLREHVLSHELFLPELLNRFDGVITFTPLNQEHIRQIAGLMLIGLNKRLDAEHGITVRVTDELLSFLVEHGYDPQFGARPMRRLIQNTVEYEAARQIVANQVAPGQEIVISHPALVALLK